MIDMLTPPRVRERHRLDGLRRGGRLGEAVLDRRRVAVGGSGLILDQRELFARASASRCRFHMLA